MGQKTFPDAGIPDIGLERGPFERLLVESLAEAVGLLKDRELPKHKRVVTRPTGNGFGPQEVTATDITRSIWDASDELSKMPRFQTLVQYAFDRGAFRMDLTSDDGVTPERSAWDRFVWGQLIHRPLEYAMQSSETETLIKFGRAQALHVDEHRLESIAAGIANSLCEKRRVIEARCPTYLTIPSDGGQYVLEPGTTIQCLVYGGACDIHHQVSIGIFAR